MKKILSIFILFAFSWSVSAQTKNAKIEKEIIDLRSEIRQAVKAKDRKSLGRFFADCFTHTHASGKVDGKTERVDFFIKGEPTIEDVEPDEIRVIVFNKIWLRQSAKRRLCSARKNALFNGPAFISKKKGSGKL